MYDLFMKIILKTLFKILLWPLKGPISEKMQLICKVKSLFGAGVFCDSFGAFADSVLGQFTGQQKANSSLDFAAGDC